MGDGTELADRLARLRERAAQIRLETDAALVEARRVAQSAAEAIERSLGLIDRVERTRDRAHAVLRRVTGR